MPDVLEFPNSRNRLHPTQKPVARLETLIRAFTRPGQIVCDPFCGSGPTLAAAQELKRRFIGVDIHATHYQTAHNRLMIAEG